MLIFEYMEIEVVKACIMLAIVTLVLILPLFKKAYPVIGLLIFAFTLPFIDSLNSISTSEENVEYFKSAKELECTNDKSKFLVSKANDWILKDDDFIKESLMIRADKCELYE